MHGDFCTLIHEKCEFTGTLSFEGTTRIDGRLVGDIFSHDLLIVGEEGYLEGQITVGAIVIYGKVKGCIHAKNRVEAKGKAQIQAEIHSPIIQLEEGVQFEGKTVMTSTGHADFKTAK